MILPWTMVLLWYIFTIFLGITGPSQAMPGASVRLGGAWASKARWLVNVGSCERSYGGNKSELHAIPKGLRGILFRGQLFRSMFFFVQSDEFLSQPSQRWKLASNWPCVAQTQPNPSEIHRLVGDMAMVLRSLVLASRCDRTVLEVWCLCVLLVACCLHAQTSTKTKKQWFSGH